MVEPLYRQIAEDLRQRIESGELPRGSRLPTEIELRERYGASRNTVRDAIKWLASRSLVETRPGQGTFVTEKIKPFVTTLTGDPQREHGAESPVYIADVMASGRTPRNSPPRVEVQIATGWLADALRIAEGTQVISRHQQRFIDDIPWSLQTTFYPMSLVTQGATRLLEARDIEGGAIEYLAAECGIKQAGYRDSISVRSPGETETAFFRLPADGRVPVYEVHRVGFDQHGNRFRLTVTVYPADRNRFVVRVGDVPPPTAIHPGQG
jgi:GntR family transcriptional regulator